MWEVLMDLKNIINKNWDKSNFISLSLDKSKVKLITDATYFLDEIYEKVPLRTRAYVIKNNIIEDTLPKCICGNSVAINKTYPDLLASASKLLFMPDLLGFLFTGKLWSEQTIASTSQMINPTSKK